MLLTILLLSVLKRNNLLILGELAFTWL